MSCAIRLRLQRGPQAFEFGWQHKFIFLCCALVFQQWLAQSKARFERSHPRA